MHRSGTGLAASTYKGGRASRRPNGKRPLRCLREGDDRELLIELIARFPLTACGQRHAQMNRAVGSLIGRGYTPAQVQRTLEEWHLHFQASGLTKTDRTQANKKVAACIESTLRNPKFQAAVTGNKHRQQIALLSLGPEAETLLEGGRTEDKATLTEYPTPPLVIL